MNSPPAEVKGVWRVTGVGHHVDGCKCRVILQEGDRIYVLLLAGMSAGHILQVYRNELEEVGCE